jgi:hypothetical protein
MGLSGRGRLTEGQERSRISRDLHDVLAHSLAVIVAQADGSRYVSQDLPAPVRSALENVADSARKALVDTQKVIDGGRHESIAGPQPSLGDVGALVDDLAGQLDISRTASGQPVDLAGGPATGGLQDCAGVVDQCPQTRRPQGTCEDPFRLERTRAGHPGHQLHRRRPAAGFFPRLRDGPWNPGDA